MLTRKYFKTILVGSISKFFFIPSFISIFFDLFIQFFFFNSNKKLFILLLIGSCLLSQQIPGKSKYVSITKSNITIHIKDTYFFIYLFTIFYLTKFVKFNSGTVHKFIIFNLIKYHSKFTIIFNSFLLLPEIDFFYEKFEDNVTAYLLESAVRLNFCLYYSSKLVEYLFRSFRLPLQLFWSL